MKQSVRTLLAMLVLALCAGFLGSALLNAGAYANGGGNYNTDSGGSNNR